jgi:hypothetical protein
VPIISTFFGIVIRMFYREHEPAHFHAEYQGQQATFDFAGTPLSGSIRSRTLHRSELEANWRRMKSGEALERIEPLE